MSVISRGVLLWENIIIKQLSIKLDIAVEKNSLKLL